MPDLIGRVAIVTGGSHGLGKQITHAYLTAGARVLICGRNASDLEATKRELDTSTPDSKSLVAVTADVSVPEDAEQLVSTAIATWGKVDILVNNAGIYGPMGYSENVDWAEWQRAIEVNLYGSVIPVRAVLPHFKQRQYGKIIQLSGGGATSPMPRMTAYAAAKAAVVRFAESIAEEVREFGIDVNSIAPGALNTRLLDQVLASGPSAVGDAFYARMRRVKEEGGTALSRGAALAVFLGSAASDGLTGRLISAAWDSWEQLPSRLTELTKTDIYTLRRVTAADRGKDWDPK